MVLIDVCGVLVRDLLVRGLVSLCKSRLHAVDLLLQLICGAEFDQISVDALVQLVELVQQPPDLGLDDRMEAGRQLVPGRRQRNLGICFCTRQRGKDFGLKFRLARCKRSWLVDNRLDQEKHRGRQKDHRSARRNLGPSDLNPLGWRGGGGRSCILALLLRHSF